MCALCLLQCLARNDAAGDVLQLAPVVVVVVVVVPPVATIVVVVVVVVAASISAVVVVIVVVVAVVSVVVSVVVAAAAATPGPPLDQLPALVLQLLCGGHLLGSVGCAGHGDHGDQNERLGNHDECLLFKVAAEAARAGSSVLSTEARLAISVVSENVRVICW